MANSEIKIFYSWQSDLSANETRNVILALNPNVLVELGYAANIIG